MMGDTTDANEETPLINPADQTFNQDGNGSSSARYGRAACFIMKLGSQTIKNFVIDKLNLDKNNIQNSFTQIIKSNEQSFNNLKMIRAMNALQWQILFPATGPITMESIDLTLWILIGRTLVKETTIPLPDWKQKKPRCYEIMPGHDFVRVREARNLLAHLPTPELSYQEFKNLWDEMSSALIRLGAAHETIDSYRCRNLDPETTERCILEVQKQGLEELKYIYLQDTKTKRCIKWAVLVISLLIVAAVVCIVAPIIIFLQPGKQCSDYKVPINLDVILFYIPREGWKAKPSLHANDPVQSPVPYLIVSDTGAVGGCIETEGCCRNMREVQQFDMNIGFDDIAFTYVVGDDGTIFEGRGLNQIPATAHGYNHRSVSIAFMGTFFKGKPSDNAMQAAKYFIHHLRDTNIVTPNFTLYGLCQVRGKFHCSPGPEVYEVIKSWRGADWGWRPTSEGNCSKTCP